MRHILHADFDAFYASVEQLDDPSLRGRPVVVGGSPNGRGVVASASYEARHYGVRSAMPMRTALDQCPLATRVSPRFERYHEISDRVMAIFLKTTCLVEPMSLDEAFLDVTETVAYGQDPVLLAKDLRKHIRSNLGLTISVGVATNKSVAKIASDMDKPDGLTVVDPGTEYDFLAPLPVDRLWGIGHKMRLLLAHQGIRTIGQMTDRPEAWWIDTFGKLGPQIRKLALGRDDRPVVINRERKSISAETTLNRDTLDSDVLDDLVDRLSQRVGEHLRSSHLKAKTVKVKLRLASFTTFTRQITFSEPINSPAEVARAASALARTEFQTGRLFRLVGISVSGLQREEQENFQQRLPDL